VHIFLFNSVNMHAMITTDKHYSLLFSSV